MKPVLIIGGTDFTRYVQDLQPTKNDLDADGSGRDIQSGRMYRNKIADKLTWEVTMLRMPESVAQSLHSKLNRQYYNATTLLPGTNTRVEKEYYTSAIVYGSQKYIKSDNKTVYDGVSFSMIER